MFSALAPMQDATNRMFMDILHILGEPDLYVTEFLRVHETSIIEKKILDVLENRNSAKPLSVQILGRDPEHIIRVAKMLCKYDICAIDMNFGCPMPKIHKKGVGGGLLDELEQVALILRALKDNIDLPITVKSRLGFEYADNFENILEIFETCAVDCLFLHARTVKGLYREPVDYAQISFAKRYMSCPVVANGDILSAKHALEVSTETGANGVMIGRSAVRNPWIFKQIIQSLNGEYVFRPTLSDVYWFVNMLIENSAKHESTELKHVSYMKKFANFIGQCVDSEGKFLHAIRLAKNISEFCMVCKDHLLDSNAHVIYNAEPFNGIVARPNCE